MQCSLTSIVAICDHSKVWDFSRIWPLISRYWPRPLICVYPKCSSSFVAYVLVVVIYISSSRDRILLHRQSIPIITYTPSSPLRHLKPANLLPCLTCWDTLLLVLLLAVQVYCCGLHGLGGLLANLPFLPLLLTSVSCAVAILWAWLFLYYQFCIESDSVPREDCKLREDWVSGQWLVCCRVTLQYDRKCS